MPEIEISNLQINFPYEPYQIQKDYMLKVVECLQNKQNGILESPTGTGKTLSLLCSSLAWLISQKALFQMRLMNNAEETSQFMTKIDKTLTLQSGDFSSSSSTWSNPLSRPPKIVYSSRTHSQLGQVMLELKKTAYSYVKVGILGSRDQLCIHPKVSAEKNVSAKVHMCKALVAARACQYYNNVEDKIKEPEFQDDVLIDIEDLVKKGLKKTCCPYYASRELQNSADILFTPYNYLLDPKTRRAHDIKLFNDVVILDEAHNVEKVCEEASSAQISSTTIALCINEITTVMRAVHDEVESDTFTENKKQQIDFNPDDLLLLKSMFMEVEKAVDAIVLTDGNDKKSKTFSGSHVFNILQQAQIQPSSLNALLEILNKISQFLVTKNESQVHQPGAGLSKFIEFLETAFNSMGQDRSPSMTDKNYKLYVEEEASRISRGNSSWATTNNVVEAGGKVLNFWCFNPGFGMRSLQDQGVHSIILTSGTLTPLSAVISEIGIPMPFQLCNPHIIKENQICAVIVEKGPAGNELKCTFQNRTNKQYLTDLGQTCLNFYRVLSGGVLVFFPSYPFLKSCVEYWQEIGIWDKLAAIKSIFIEPQNKDSLRALMDEYYKTIEEKNAASLFAVCRGKVSEGLDFADAKGRAVIVIGLPFPPFYDPKVVLKRSYLDSGKKSDPSKLDGNEWYNLEALKAVNQAVGRVIRHSDDHGAIIFCDCRFTYGNNFKMLSAWLQHYVTICPSFGQALKHVSTFSKFWKDAPPIVRHTHQDINARSSSTTESKYRPIQAAQKLAPSTVSKVDFTQFYNQPISEKKTDVPVKRACESILDSLDDECSLSTIPTNNLASSSTRVITEKPCNPALNIPITPQVKKRKIHVKPIRFESEKKDQGYDLAQFIQVLQKKLNSDEMKVFKEAITKYRSTSDCDTFISTVAKVFLSKKDKALDKLFKEFPVFLKPEHTNSFWDSYRKNVETYK